MTLLNRKVDYALLILCHLHHCRDGASARVIAEQLRLSRGFVANILKALCHNGFVASQRGIHGGYVLNQPAASVTLAELLDALEGPVRLAECNSDNPEECCSIARECPIRAPVAEVHRRIRDVLETVTLDQLFGATGGRPDSVPVELELSRCLK